FAIRVGASLSRQDVGGFFRSGGVIAAMAIDASDVALISVHRLDADVAAFALTLVGSLLFVRFLVVRFCFLRADANSARAGDQRQADKKSGNQSRASTS